MAGLWARMRNHSRATCLWRPDEQFKAKGGISNWLKTISLQDALGT